MTTTAQSYDPIPDLAQLLCAAQRQPSPLGGITVPLARLSAALSLPELAYSDEAEVAIREALGDLEPVDSRVSGVQENEK